MIVIAVVLHTILTIHWSNVFENAKSVDPMGCRRAMIRRK